jgi:hypothetical protein
VLPLPRVITTLPLYNPEELKQRMMAKRFNDGTRLAEWVRERAAKAEATMLSTTVTPDDPQRQSEEHAPNGVSHLFDEPEANNSDDFTPTAD